MVDSKKGLWSNRTMQFQRKHIADNQSRSGFAVPAKISSAKNELMAHAPIILGSLLALLLIIGRGAGSG
jgi:hypothetical protein